LAELRRKKYPTNEEKREQKETGDNNNWLAGGKSKIDSSTAGQ